MRQPSPRQVMQISRELTTASPIESGHLPVTAARYCPVLRAAVVLTLAAAFFLELFSTPPHLLTLLGLSMGILLALLLLRSCSQAMPELQAVPAAPAKDAVDSGTDSDATGGTDKRAGHASEQDARLRLMMTQIPSLLWTTDRQLHVTYLLGSGAAGHGGGLIQLSGVQGGKSLYELVADRQDPQLVAHEYALQGETAQYEMHENGSILNVRVEPLRDDNGMIIGCIAAAHDITQRKQTEDALRTSEARYRSLFEATFEAVLLVERTRILDVNPAFESLFGYRQEETAGMSLMPLIAPESLQVVLEHLASGSRTVFEASAVRRNGTAFSAEMQTKEVDYRGRSVHVVAVRDITERKQTQRERLEAERLRVEIEKERELLDLKERFITMVSHEFRTPLTVILSSAELVERYFDRLSEARRREHLGKIREQSLLLSAMMSDMLVYSKMQAQRMTFKPLPLDLRAFCQSLYDQFQFTGGDQHDILYTYDCPHNSYLLDEKLLQHILVNLLSNAIKYSPAGTLVRFSAAMEDARLKLVVSDKGIGIPAEDLERLYEPFHRAGNTGYIDGTGLGLAIVKNAVDSHGGEIICTSAVDVGTTFVVLLPAQPVDKKTGAG